MFSTNLNKEGCDPTQKYHKVWDAFIYYNFNQMLRKSGTDLIIDETTWSSAYYGPVHERLIKKMTEKGRQHMLAVDAHHWYVYEYVPGHKILKSSTPFTVEGPDESKHLIDWMAPMVKDNAEEADDKRRQIVDKRTTLGMDNLFSGDATSQEVDKRG